MAKSLPYCKAPCAECPFRKDSLKGWLGASKMQFILEKGSFVCHKNTKKQCAGHMIINGNDNQFVRLAQRFGMPVELSGQDLIFNNKPDCIEHHNYENATADQAT